ncbi:hypothetical protein ACLI1A_02535 [Flavobacterium sp. RHBU_3]|uniref:hypothetical protein n=1 Tax=Flavobacterium sp. RHBU_3 TaxID=3391184 RepID=UPI00398512C1
MKNFILSIILLSALFSCKKDSETLNPSQPHDSGTGTTKQAVVPIKRFEPQHKSTETVGTVRLNNTSYTVTTEFTDAVVFKQDAVNVQGKPDVLNYREKLVHLIDNRKDTITLNKELFKNHLPDYESMTLQGVMLNHPLKKGFAPLIVYFCMPDSDYCYRFDVRLDSSGTILPNEIDDDDFGTEEE